jgi:hypothetical protein
MLCQGLSLIVAALIHFGVLMTGYEHRRAGTAETVIGVVLLGALISTWIRPQATRTIGLSAQGFALLGTLVGIFTIVIGVGPRTVRRPGHRVRPARRSGRGAAGRLPDPRLRHEEQVPLVVSGVEVDPATWEAHTHNLHLTRTLTFETSA